MNSNLLRHCIKYSLVLLIMLTVIVSILLWRAAGYFVNNRNNVYPAATEFIDKISTSVNIESTECATKTHCLLFTPIKDAPLEKRAAILRQQLPDFGVTPLPYGDIQGIVVILHGKGSRKENSVYTALRLTAAGLAVIVPDLPGHGENQLPYAGFGTLDGEAEIAIDSLNYARNYLHQHHQTPTDLPAALWGYSMGGSYANYTLAKYPNHFQSLVIQSSFDRADTILKDRLSGMPKIFHRPLIAYFGFLIKLRADIDVRDISPVTVAKTINIPVIQFHGEQDKTIPFASGQALYQAYPSKDKTFIPVPDGKHNDSLNKSTLVYAPIIAFILQHF